MTARILLLACLAVTAVAVDQPGPTVGEQIEETLLGQDGEAPSEGKPDAPPPQAVVDFIVQSIFDELQNTRFQWANAIMALVLGCILLRKGESAFKLLILVSTFVFTMILAMNQITVMWDLDDHSVIRRVVGVEVGAVFTYAVWHAYDGMMILVGGGIGAIVGHKVKIFCLQMGLTFMDPHKGTTQQVVALIYYSVIVLACTHQFAQKKYVGLLAPITPAIGGALFTSSVFYGLTNLAIPFHDKVGLPAPATGAYIDFLDLLWSFSSEDVGLFANTSHATLDAAGHKIVLDRLCGQVLWLLLWFIGTRIQWREFREAKTSTSDGKVAAREKEDLQEPLLPDGI